MTNFQIKDRLEFLAKEEQRITKEVIELIALAMVRRAYLDFRFKNIFEWLTLGLNYSKPAAQRRIDAARLFREVPAVREGLASGNLNLTTLSKVQVAIRAEEKERKVSREEKESALREVVGKSGFTVEQKLVELFPAAAELSKRELRRPMSEGGVRCSMNLSAETFENLKRVKEVLSHKMPNATDAEALAYALDFLLEKIDPLRKQVSSAAEPSGKIRKLRAIHQKHRGECSWVDPVSKKKCESRHQVQVDHIIPKALGGADSAENLRLLCRQHNLYEAARILGKEKMAPFRKSP